jgi:hypothetical protein
MSSKLTVAKQDFVKCQIEKGKFTPKSTIGMRTATELEHSRETLTVVVVSIAQKNGCVFQPSTVQAKLIDGSCVPTFGVIKAMRGLVMIFSCFTRKDGAWSSPPGNAVTPVIGYQGPDSSFSGDGTAQFAFAFPAEINEKIASLEIED